MYPTHWIEDRLAIDGASLHYVRTGHGDKPALILVNGFSDNASCWLQTALDLEDAYDIVMPDQQGHGQSSRVEPGQKVDLAADLAGLIRALGLERPIVAGHSMGAATAFQLGVRYPEIARALILEDPPWREPVANEGAGQPVRNHLAEATEKNQRSTVEQIKAETRIEHPDWPDWVIDTWCPAKKDLDPNFLTVMRLNLTDWQEGIPKLTCPTLIITANPKQGGIVTPEIAERVRALNPRCQVVQFPDAGHHIRFARYEAYMDRFNGFLSELD
jgi:N-formylmaleamate deformylase